MKLRLNSNILTTARHSRNQMKNETGMSELNRVDLSRFT